METSSDGMPLSKAGERYPGTGDDRSMISSEYGLRIAPEGSVGAGSTVVTTPNDRDPQRHRASPVAEEGGAEDEAGAKAVEQGAARAIAAGYNPDPETGLVHDVLTREDMARLRETFMRTAGRVPAARQSSLAPPLRPLSSLSASHSASPIRTVEFHAFAFAFAHPSLTQTSTLLGTTQMPPFISPAGDSDPNVATDDGNDSGGGGSPPPSEAIDRPALPRRSPSWASAADETAVTGGTHVTAATYPPAPMNSGAGASSSRSVRSAETFGARTGSTGALMIVPGALDAAQFKKVVVKLCRDADEAPPRAKDLDKAFSDADVDHSNTVDFDEFVLLYAKVKKGEVKGMGGGFFTRSLFRGSRRKVPASTPENDSLDGGDNDNDNDSVSSLGSGGLTAQSFRTPKGGKKGLSSMFRAGPSATTPTREKLKQQQAEWDRAQMVQQQLDSMQVEIVQLRQERDEAVKAVKQLGNRMAVPPGSSTAGGASVLSGSATRSSGETTAAAGHGEGPTRNVHLGQTQTFTAREMRSLISRTPRLTPETVKLIRQRWQAASYSAPGQSWKSLYSHELAKHHKDKRSGELDLGKIRESQPRATKLFDSSTTM